MAVSKRGINVIIVLLAIVLLYALNPTSEDFVAWRSGQARSQAASGDTSGLFGVLKKGAGAAAGAMNGLVAKGYKRHDYFVCSTFTLGDDSYLGVARLFFKLK
jgi:hypothetical protein